MEGGYLKGLHWVNSAHVGGEDHLPAHLWKMSACMMGPEKTQGQILGGWEALQLEWFITLIKWTLNVYT